MQHQRKVMKKRKKICNFCLNDINSLDYKDINKVKKYISERGKILPRRVTGNCAKHQRLVTATIKRARIMALLAFVEE
ncbi:MAG: 30S ribosomal protein S18 [Clostridiales bacterium GWE2_32_10]|nr:MAG: 30S ribosomal protein S18 [Clostridiales bacterium GWE2_32_10]HBY20969.1 30S ribosomal protein S18 [Clostridiales bacterium]